MAVKVGDTAQSFSIKDQHGNKSKHYHWWRSEGCVHQNIPHIAAAWYRWNYWRAWEVNLIKLASINYIKANQVLFWKSILARKITFPV